MTISTVQTTSTPSSTESVTFTSNITVGNTVFFAVGEYDNSTTETITSVTINGTSVAYNTLVFPQINVTEAQGCAIVMVPNIQISGQKVVAYTYSGSSVIATAGWEVSGLGPNPVLNASVSNSGNIATMTTGTTPASTVANGYVIAAMATYNGSSSAPTQTWTNTSLGIDSHLSVGWEIQTSTNQTYAWTQAGGGTLGWAGGIVVVVPGPVLVQHASNSATFTTGTSGSVTTTISAAGAGNTLVAAVSLVGSAGTPSITTVKTGSNAENWAKGVEQDDATNTASAGIWVDPNTTGGGTTVVVNAAFGATATSSNSCGVFVDVYEFSGLASSNPVDVTTVGSLGQTGTSWSSGTTGTTTQANEVFIGVATTTTASGGSSTVTGPSSPWVNETLLSGSVAFGGSAFDCYSLSGYQVASATGTATYAGTTGQSSIWNAAALTLRQYPAGAALTSSATLSVSPSFTATRHHGHGRSATLNETPTFVATRIHGRTRTATLTPTPTFAATRIRGRVRSALSAQSPTFTAGRVHGHRRGNTLSILPTFLATKNHGHPRSASLTPAPTFLATRLHGHGRNATLTPNPTFVATKLHGHPRGASLTPAPTFNAGRTRGRVRSALKTITPTFLANRIRGHTRLATLAVSPVFYAVANVSAAGHFIRSAALSVTPAFLASRVKGHTRSASSFPSPTFSAGRHHGHGRSAISSITPAFLAGRSQGHRRHATLGVVPTLLASAIVHGVTFISPTASQPIACNSYVDLVSYMTSSSRAGAPYQGNMRQLAVDRWNYMYPSE